ncbi:hypothetical protein J6590_094297 [Homalodisca vitripennis]|nr:hypothetical protein J6590_094297 [Homalodisca vitripennis]
MRASLREASFVLSSPYHSSGPTPSTGNPVTPELQYNTIGTNKLKMVELSSLRSRTHHSLSAGQGYNLAVSVKD